MRKTIPITTLAVATDAEPRPKWDWQLPDALGKVHRSIGDPGLVPV